ncbi:hypothetical protein KY333_04300 [Candidatus Woesearchaeota archaeon]|nr:hypothetical protein [Candidatus Woesearchaeota archaeon]
MEQKNYLEKMLDAYQQIAKDEDLPKEVSLALYGMLAEQLPENQRGGMYAGLSVGYAKLAEELKGDAKDNAMAISQMYMNATKNQYQDIIDAKKKCSPLPTYNPIPAQPYKASATNNSKAA